MIEKFIDWYNTGDGEKKMLRITVIVFVLATFIKSITENVRLWLFIYNT